jgi:hypothetical protein
VHVGDEAIGWVPPDNLLHRLLEHHETSEHFPCRFNGSCRAEALNTFRQTHLLGREPELEDIDMEARTAPFSLSIFYSQNNIISILFSHGHHVGELGGSLLIKHEKLEKRVVW